MNRPKTSRRFSPDKRMERLIPIALVILAVLLVITMAIVLLAVLGLIPH